MEWVFPIAFAIAFIVTKKDLALVCASVSAASSAMFVLCDPEVWTYEQILTMTLALNLVLAMTSAVHWSNTRKPLARAMVWIASIAILVNTVQVFQFYEWTSNALLGLQFLALIAILTLDGRKEYLHDVATGLFGIARSMGFAHGNHKSGKG